MAPLALAAQPLKEVSAPKKIFYDDKTLTYNPAWQNDEAYLKVNLDSDPEDEIIISFSALSTLEAPHPQEKEPAAFPGAKQEVPLLQNYAFYQIYDQGADGYFRLVKTITGMDRLGSLKVIKLDKEKPPAIAIFSPGGENYLDLAIYLWREGGYRLLFNEGSREPIEIDTENNTPVIRVGQNGKTFVWDTLSQSFTQR